MLFRLFFMNTSCFMDGLLVLVYNPVNDMTNAVDIIVRIAVLVGYDEAANDAVVVAVVLSAGFSDPKVPLAEEDCPPTVA